jgi:hypothetical protein
MSAIVPGVTGRSSIRDLPERLADDLLFGAEAIAEELGIPLRRAFYLLEKAHIPGTKCGRIWTASRRRLRQHLTGE